MPQVSVLLPFHNSEDFIFDAVESVRRQTFPDWELILIDDGSGDESSKRLQPLLDQDRRLKLIVLPSHEGLVKALNVGLKEVRAELVARMDADDVCLPERLERQVAFLRNHSDAVIVGSAAQKIDSKGNRLWVKPVITDPTALGFWSLFSVRLIHPSVAFRKKEIEKVGGYRDSFPHAEDFDLWSRLLEKHPFGLANLDEVLLEYREHDQSVSKQNSQVQWSHTLKIIRTNLARYIQVSEAEIEGAFQRKTVPPVTQVKKKQLLLRLWYAFCHKHVLSLPDQIKLLRLIISTW